MKSSSHWLLLAVALVAQPVTAKPASVVLAAVESSPQQSTLTLVGELRAMRNSVISAEVAGAVAQVLVERGDHVLNDTPLALIREQPARFEWQAARGRAAEAVADVDRAVINERRIGRLLQRKAASQDEYDSVQVELDKARAILSTRRAQVELAADALARHQLRAPFPGVVVERMVERGQWLDVGDPCYTVEDISRMRAVLAVPQQYYEKIQLGSVVELSYEALPGELFSAKLTRKLPLVNQRGRSFEIWIELDNTDQRLVSGLSTRAQVPLQVAVAGLVLVPRDAVLRAPDGEAWLWLAHSPEREDSPERKDSPERDDSLERDDSPESPLVVTRVALAVVAAVGQNLMVRGEELDVGMRVVVRGNETLREGQHVLALTEE
jgi:membrane fusion protein (multidrug efflux system)